MREARLPYLHVPTPHTHAYTYAHTCTCVHTSTYMHTCTYVHIDIHVCVYMHAHPRRKTVFQQDESVGHHKAPLPGFPWELSRVEQPRLLQGGPTPQITGWPAILQCQGLQSIPISKALTFPPDHGITLHGVIISKQGN